MAANEFSSKQEEGLYRLVVLLNSTLQFMLTQLEELTATRVLSPEYLKEMRRLTDKIETEIAPK